MRGQAQQPAPDVAALEEQLQALDALGAEEDPAAKREKARAALLARIAEARARDAEAANARDLAAQEQLEAGHAAAVTSALSRLRDLDDDFEALDVIAQAHRRLGDELKARGATPRLLPPVPVDLGACSAMNVERLAALARSFGLFGGDQGLWLLPLGRL